MALRAAKSSRQDRVLSEALEDIQQGLTPHLNGAPSYVGTVKIVDPYDGKERAKIVSVRDDPVGDMAQRSQLGDESETAARLRAAHMWQALYEKAEIGNMRTIDYTVDRVDGGRPPDMGGELVAQQKLNDLRGVLGIIGDRIVTLVLGQKHSLDAVAAIFGRRRRMDRAILGNRFRKCLDVLAEEFGVSTRKDGAQPCPKARDFIRGANRRSCAGLFSVRNISPRPSRSRGALRFKFAHPKESAFKRVRDGGELAQRSAAARAGSAISSAGAEDLRVAERAEGLPGGGAHSASHQRNLG